MISKTDYIFAYAFIARLISRANFPKMAKLVSFHPHNLTKNNHRCNSVLNLSSRQQFLWMSLKISVKNLLVEMSKFAWHRCSVHQNNFYGIYWILLHSIFIFIQWTFMGSKNTYCVFHSSKLWQLIKLQWGYNFLIQICGWGNSKNMTIENCSIDNWHIFIFSSFFQSDSLKSYSVFNRKMLLFKRLLLYQLTDSEKFMIE